MSKKPKLELTWIGKENRPKSEPRILLEDPAKPYHAKRHLTSADFFDNRLIFGNYLLALKPWCYVLIPHDEIVENMTLDGLAARFAC